MTSLDQQGAAARAARLPSEAWSRFSPDFRAQAEQRRLAEERARQADIDRAKAVMRQRAVPGWFCGIMLDCAARHGVSAELLVTKSRKYAVVAARNEAIWLVKDSKPSIPATRIARWFGRERTAIIYALAVHAARHGLRPYSAYDLDRRWKRQGGYRKRAAP